jgi:hypothetical protein
MMITASANSANKSAREPNGSATFERAAMGRVVRAVVVKELRQNWVNLALVICLEFIIVCVAEWFRSGWLFDPQGSNQFHNILLFPAVQAAITLGCGVAGLLLGILQPLADRNFDLWAFLTHRPVPRWWLFLGRALAGLILYGTAVGLPVAFALAIAPTRMGGRFFLWEYTLPPIADWVAGLAYYFAGLLIMERQARWYGSRVVPLVAVLAGSMAGMEVVSFWTALMISGVLIAVYVMAGAGAAVSHGFALRAPRLTKWALGILLLAGFSLVAVGPTIAAVSKVMERRSHVLQRRDSVEGGHLWTYENRASGYYYELMPDATITKVSYVTEWNEKTLKTETLSQSRVDLEGHAVPEPKASETNNPALRGLYIREHPSSYAPSFRDFGYRVTPTSAPIWNTKMENVWYWVPGRNIFYVYRQRNWDAANSTAEADRRKAAADAQYLGTFGVYGLQASGRAEPFDQPQVENPYGEGLMVLTPRVLYRLDLEHPSLTPFFTATGDETLLAESLETAPSNDVATSTRNLFIETSKRIVNISHDGVVRWSLSFTHDPEHFFIAFHDFPKLHKHVFEYTHKIAEGGVRTEREHIVEYYDDAGKLLDVKTIPVWYHQDSTFTPALLPRGERQLQRADYRAGAMGAAGSPITLAGYVLVYGPWWGEMRYGADVAVVGGAYGLGWRFFAAALPIMAGYGIGAWVLAWIYARSMARRWWWAVLGFVFGPAALLTFVALHRLPRWVRCPACGRRRLRREERCGKCGTAWAAPARTGTEIWSLDHA